MQLFWKLQEHHGFCRYIRKVPQIILSVNLIRNWTSVLHHVHNIPKIIQPNTWPITELPQRNRWKLDILMIRKTNTHYLNPSKCGQVLPLPKPFCTVKTQPTRAPLPVFIKGTTPASVSRESQKQWPAGTGSHEKKCEVEQEALKQKGKATHTTEHAGENNNLH